MSTGQIIVSIVGAVFASTGFWSVVNFLIQQKTEKKKKSAEKESEDHKLLLGLAHDRLYTLCREYIDREEITVSEYDNLQYIYGPYNRSGGNGTGRKLMEAVEKLPLVSDFDDLKKDA